jgi:hypothetical protein
MAAIGATGRSRRARGSVGDALAKGGNAAYFFGLIKTTLCRQTIVG